VTNEANIPHESNQYIYNEPKKDLIRQRMSSCIEVYPEI
jgi:hypothetical protein